MATTTDRCFPFTTAEWSALKRCAATMRRWDEDCCNGVIQYDDNDSNPRRYSVDRWNSFTIPGPVVADKSKAAIEKAGKIAAKHGLSVYHQSVPRGCALYVFSAADLRGRKIDECYSMMAKPVL